MHYKWIGAVLIVAGCGTTGFLAALNHRKEEKQLNQLAEILGFMENELQYRLTPLPDLCRLAAREATGVLREVFLNMSRELDWQISPDACSCMTAALKKSTNISPSVRRLLLSLGHTLGRFDLDGQLRGIQSVKINCETAQRKLGKDRENRLRGYQTLGLCAGAAMAILLA